MKYSLKLYEDAYNTTELFEEIQIDFANRDEQFNNKKLAYGLFYDCKKETEVKLRIMFQPVEDRIYRDLQDKWDIEE